MSKQRRGGIIYLKIDGVQYEAIGNFSYNLGTEKRESLVGSSGVQGYKATPQPAFIEGEIRDSSDLSLKKMSELDDVTATLELANGKTVVLKKAYSVSEGTGNSEEGNIPFRLESALPGEEISP